MINTAIFRNILSACIVVFSIYNVVGQSATIPLRHRSYHLLDRMEIKSGELMNDFHSSNKPLDRRGVTNFIAKIDSSGDMELSNTDLDNIDYLYMDNMEWSEFGRRATRKPIFKTFYKHPAHLFHVDIPKFQFMVNPVFNVTVGMETDGEGLRFINSRGAEIRGQVDDFFGFYFYLTENQAKFPTYVQDRIAQGTAVPGAGYYKRFKESGHDFFTPRGYITLSATEHVNFQFGYDKNFIGNGYRSVFLSDYGNDYLFLKTNVRVWKLHYQTMIAELVVDYLSGGIRYDRILDKKYMVNHHLSINIGKHFNIGIYEAVVFARKNHFELQYLNPVIFYRSVEQALGSPDNAFIGFDFKANFARHFQLYGQFLLDELNFGEEFQFGQTEKSFFYEIFHPQKWWGTKFAGQLGLKYIDAFGLDQLDLQFEANMGRPYLYGHNTGVTSWSHYDQPLAHPLGANFTEMISIVNYQPLHNLSFNAKFIHAKMGLDPNDTTSWGGDIFIPNIEHEMDYGNDIHQGVLTKLNHAELRLTYMPWHNINIDGSYIFRKLNSEDDALDRSTHFFNVAVRVNIPHRSNDF